MKAYQHLPKVFRRMPCRYPICIFIRYYPLSGQIGGIFSLCQSEIGANWQINMSANWRGNWQKVCQFVHLDCPQWVEESVYLSRFWAKLLSKWPLFGINNNNICRNNKFINNCSRWRFCENYWRRADSSC